MHLFPLNLPLFLEILRFMRSTMCMCAGMPLAQANVDSNTAFDIQNPFILRKVTDAFRLALIFGL